MLLKQLGVEPAVASKIDFFKEDAVQGGGEIVHGRRPDCDGGLLCGCSHGHAKDGEHDGGEEEKQHGPFAICGGGVRQGPNIYARLCLETAGHRLLVLSRSFVSYTRPTAAVAAALRRIARKASQPIAIANGLN